MGTADPESFAALMHPTGCLRILHCGDSDDDAHLIARLLRQARSAIDFQHVSERDALVKALDASAIDIVLCDFGMPAFDGPEALRIVRARSATLPFILLSGSAAEDRAIESLQVGATDYVSRERLGRLSAVVDRALREAAVRRHDEQLAVELAESRQLLAGVLTALPDFVYAVDRENRLLACNARASEALVGNPAKLTPNALLRELDPHGIDVTAMQIENSQLMEEGRELRDQGRHRIDVDGGERYLEVDKTLLRDRDGDAVSGLVVVVRDITERLQLERAVLEVSEQEQRRMGSDLHDGLGQDLAALKVLLSVVSQAIPEESTGVHERLGRAQDILRGAITTIGRLARGLVPVELDRASLSVALAGLLERNSAAFGVHCRFVDHSGAALADVDPSIATHLYRIAQEAVGNAARHGAANSIEVKLGAAPDVYVDIRDNGHGFDATAMDASPGMGLRLMQYRAHLIGGVLTVASGPNGTSIRCQCQQYLPKSGRAPRRRAGARHGAATAPQHAGPRQAGDPLG